MDDTQTSHLVMYDDLYHRISKVDGKYTLELDKDGNVISIGGRDIWHPTPTAAANDGKLTITVAGTSTEFTANSSADKSVTVPIATKDVVGLVKAGTNILVGTDGAISVTHPASISTIKLGTKEFTSSTPSGTVTMNLGDGLVWKDDVLTTRGVAVFTDASDPLKKEGDVLIVVDADSEKESTPGTEEGRFVYSGAQVTGDNGTYIIESNKVGSYYIQRAVDVQDTSCQYTRVLRADGTEVSGWKLPHSEWA